MKTTNTTLKIEMTLARAGAFWPVGAGEHAAGRALVKAGKVRETWGECDGCNNAAHRPGEAHRVVVFVVP